jgi:glycosyltransferase involved in cell wall biosynthesis
MREGGFEPAVAFPAGGRLERALARLGVECVPWQPAAFPGEPLAARRARLADLLLGFRPGLVHANSLAMGRLSGPVAAELDIPSLSHVRDMVRLSRAARADLSRHARLLAVSNAAGEFLVQQGVPRDKVFTLYNGIDLARFHPRAATGWLHADLGLPTDRLLIGTVGQLVMRKGHDVLARAAAAVASQVPQAHFVVVGSRSSRKAEAMRHEACLRAAFSAGALAGRGHFLGYREDVDLLLGEFTLLAHPARQEPLGRVLLEAAAAGLPIVATDVGGTREIFPPEAGAAHLVPGDNPVLLARAIVSVARDADVRRRLGAAARARAGAFDVSQHVPKLLSHYRAVAERQPAP